MNLQNIVVDFKASKLHTLYEGKHYEFDAVVETLLPIKQEFSTAYNIDFDFVVAQLTEDQHLDVPRFVCNKDGENTIISIQDVRDNHLQILVDLQGIRATIEQELTTLLNNN